VTKTPLEVKLGSDGGHIGVRRILHWGVDLFNPSFRPGLHSAHVDFARRPDNKIYGGHSAQRIHEAIGAPDPFPTALSKLYLHPSPRAATHRPPLSPLHAALRVDGRGERRFIGRTHA
jgi:hypothetical protein